MAQQQCEAHDVTSHHLTTGLSAFSWDLYKLFIGGEGNIFLSPYSVCAALMLTNLGAKGDSEGQIRKALGLDQLDAELAHKEYKTLREILNSKTRKTTTLAIANRIFAKKGLSVRRDYTDKALLYHDSEMELLDFSGESEKSRIRINTWVEDQTRNKIKELLPAKSINALTLVVLVNAVYFKGDWMEKFDAKKTEKCDFHVSLTETVKVDMMRAKRKCFFARDDKLKCTGLLLPYKDGNVSMVIMLPYEKNGLESMESSLTGESLRSFCNDLMKGYKPEVILGLPKFKMELTYDLTKALPKLGISDILNSEKADFSAMLESSPDAFISDVIHKTFVDFNEEGTEAAAATAMMMRGNAMPRPPEEFIADHPFLFLIRDNDTGAILFIGRFMTPPQ